MAGVDLLPDSVARVATARWMPWATRAVYGVLLVALATSLGGPVHPDRPMVDPDFYARMALDYGSVDLAPFSYRVLVPTLAGLLPGPLRLGFAVIGASSIVVAGWSCSRLLVYHDRAGVPAELIVLASPLTLVFVRSPIGTDAFALGVVAFGLLLITRRRWVVLSVVMVVGVLGRETTLVLAAALLSATWGDLGRRRASVITAVVTAPAVLMALVLRATPILYGRQLPGRLQLPPEIFSWRAAHDGGLLVAVIAAVVFSLGPLWITSWRTVRLAPRSPLVRLAAPVVLLSVVPLLVASDWTRLLAAGTAGAAVLAGSRLGREAMARNAIGLVTCGVLGQFWRGGIALPLVAGGIAVATALAAEAATGVAASTGWRSIRRGGPPA